MGSQQFCLKWNNHHTNIVTVFEELLSNEALVDVTLACDGLSLKAHKMVLSACSPFFQSLFIENPCKHPIVIMKDMKYIDLKAIVDFMYKGEVNISHDQMSAFLKTAETLRVKGLAMLSDESQESEEDQRLIQPSNEPVSQFSTQFNKSPNLQVQKRKLGASPPRRKRRTSHSSESSIDRTEESVQTKVKERDSPEIVEEASHDSSSSHTIIPQSKKSSVPSSQSEGVIPPSTLALTISQTSSERTPEDKQEKTTRTLSNTDVVFPRELSVYKEPSMPDQSVSGSQSLLPFSVQGPVPGSLSSATNAESFSLFPISSSNESQLITPTSVTPMSSEASTSHNIEDMTIDIKPSLVPYGEQTVSSPVDESSHSQNQDSSGLNLFRSPIEHTSLSEPSTSQGNLHDQQQILPYQSEQQSAQIFYRIIEQEFNTKYNEDVCGPQIAPLRRGRPPSWLKELCVENKISQNHQNMAKLPTGKFSDCVMCTNRTTKKRKRTSWVCVGCGGIGLCPGHCWNEYHAQRFHLQR